MQGNKKLPAKDLFKSRSPKRLISVAAILSLVTSFLTATATSATGEPFTTERVGSVVTVTVDCSGENTGTDYIFDVYRGDTLTFASLTSDDMACNRFTYRLFGTTPSLNDIVTGAAYDTAGYVYPTAPATYFTALTFPIKSNAPIGTLALEQTFWTSNTTGGINRGIDFKIRVLPTPPTISSISPSSGNTAGGTPVTITGTGFASGATVNLGGTACTSVAVVSSTEITCTTGARSAGSVNVVVTNSDTGQGVGANMFTYTSIVNPTVSSISPNSGTSLGGEQVTISGTGFISGVSVTIGGQACTSVVVVSATSITCTTPAGTSGAKNVVVTNTNTGTGTGIGLYTYIVYPTITSISPQRGNLYGGTEVTIYGTGFVDGASITIGGTECAPVQFVAASELICTTGESRTGTADVVVLNPNDTSVTSNDAFTFFKEVSGTNTGSPLKIDITFDSNFGNSERFTSQTTLGLPLLQNKFVRAGYKFVSWNTEKDGSGINYFDQEVIYSQIDEVLYAQWVLVSAKKIVKPFVGTKIKLNSAKRTSIEKWIAKLPSYAHIRCQGFTPKGLNLSTEKDLAFKRATNVCRYAAKIRSDLTYSITLKTKSSVTLDNSHVWVYFN